MYLILSYHLFPFSKNTVVHSQTRDVVLANRDCEIYQSTNKYLVLFSITFMNMVHWVQDTSSSKHHQMEMHIFIP